MRIILDWLLVVTSIVIMIKSCSNIIKCKAYSISDYIIVVVFVFNCLPIVCDLLIGQPIHKIWNEGLALAIADNQASIIYDFYILGALIVLKLYQKNHKRNMLNTSINNGIFKYNKNLSIIVGLAIFSPIICLVLSGNISNYLIYASTEVKNVTEGFAQLMTTLYLISLFAFCYRVFGSPKRKFTTLFLIFYAFCNIWLSGKRYMVVTIALAYLYCYENCLWKKKKNIKGVLLSCIALFMIYTVYYVTHVKAMATLDYTSIYSQLRLDFGRDDVIKFVIKNELDSNPILQYRGQTLLSLIFMIIPRTIWPTKPYPHYRYLTATLYNLTPTTIPAGMTPSIFEMLIANLWWIGIPVAYISLYLFLKSSDKVRNIENRMVLLLVAVGALTQSLDSMLVYFYYALIALMFKNIRLKLNKI